MELELPLTDLQEEVLDFIAQYIHSENYPPTNEEIQEAVGLSNPGSVYRVLEGLEKKNYIKKEKNVPRGITLTEVGQQFLPSGQTDLFGSEGSADSM